MNLEAEQRERERFSKIDRIVHGLPQDLHAAGSLGSQVLDAMVRHCAELRLEHTLETGAGKSTLLLSQLSPHHLCFALDLGGSVTVVRESPLCRSEALEIVEGPTQKTLPSYRFQHRFQLALIDGPHAFPFPNLEYYFIYPHLDPGALLLVDDINIPTIYQMVEFLQEDPMFELLEIVCYTAFFRRTTAPTFDPYEDGWWLQPYNQREGRQYQALWQRRFAPPQRTLSPLPPRLAFLKQIPGMELCRQWLTQRRRRSVDQH